MFRIRFTPADLLRTRIACGPDPMWEVVLSLQVLRTRGSEAHLGQWRRHVVRSVPHGHLWRLLEVSPQGSPEVMAALRESVSTYYRAGLAPFWGSIRAAVLADRNGRSEQYTVGGLDRLLSTLHPRVRWRSPVLEVLDLCAPDLHLDGRGLLLQPSYFCESTPTRPRDPGDQPALIYPITRPGIGLAVVDPKAEHPAAALLGRTRAAALAATTGGCTTSDLARRCGIAVSTASHQATVLRDGGLVRTRRVGGSVVHEITDLGRRLLAAVPVVSQPVSAGTFRSAAR